jgi:hypothetical protein
LLHCDKLPDYRLIEGLQSDRNEGARKHETVRSSQK